MIFPALIVAFCSGCLVGFAMFWLKFGERE